VPQLYDVFICEDLKTHLLGRRCSSVNMRRLVSVFDELTFAGSDQPNF